MNNIGYIAHQPPTGMPAIWKLSAEEPYYIRRFDPTIKRDLETVRIMDLHPSVQDMPNAVNDDGSELSYEAMLSQTDELDQEQDKPPCSIFAVTDDESRVLGWVWYYTDAHNSFPDVLAKELSLDGQQTLFLEISYQKLGSDWPEELLKTSEAVEVEFLKSERKGVAVSGVRQTLHYLRATAKLKKIIVYAYTETYNLPSEKVLSKNGFKCAAEPEYEEGVPYHVWYREL